MKDVKKKVVRLREALGWSDEMWAKAMSVVGMNNEKFAATVMLMSDRLEDTNGYAFKQTLHFVKMWLNRHGLWAVRRPERDVRRAVNVAGLTQQQALELMPRLREMGWQVKPPSYLSKSAEQMEDDQLSRMGGRM